MQPSYTCTKRRTEKKEKDNTPQNAEKVLRITDRQTHTCTRNLVP